MNALGIQVIFMELVKPFHNNFEGAEIGKVNNGIVWNWNRSETRMQYIWIYTSASNKLDI